VALGGDTVEIKGKEVYVNGRALPRELAGPATVVTNTGGKMVQGKVYKGRVDYLYWCARDWAHFGRLH
jgi:hypothetical protein